MQRTKVLGRSGSNCMNVCLGQSLDWGGECMTFNIRREGGGACCYGT